MLAKAPEPGRAKTRLCPPATPAEAADVAAAALLDTLDAVTSAATEAGGQPLVAWTGRLSNAARCAELTRALRDIPRIRQRGEGLGARIAAAHADVAALFPGATFQVGMDTPQIRPDLLAECLGRLEATDAVLGLTPDGGWWALGLREPAAASLIASVPTSRSDTGERTLHALRRAGLRVCALPEVTDVDTAVDAREVAAAVPGSRFAAAVAGVAGLTAADTIDPAHAGLAR